MPKKAKKKAVKKNLSPRKTQFPKQYVIDHNATKAAERAGYSVKTAYSIGQRLLKDVEVSAEIERLDAKLTAKVEVDQEQVLYEYKLIGFSSIDDYFTIDENTGELRLKSFADMPKNASRAIESIQQDRIIKESADGKQMVVHDRVKIKLWKKTEALEMIARHTGGFVETKKQETEVKVSQTFKHYHELKVKAEKELNGSTSNRIKQHLNG